MSTPHATLKFKIQAILIALAAMLLVLGVVVFGILSQLRFQSVDDAWSIYNKRVTNIENAMSDLSRNIGYGGFIHNFKNLVLRRDLQRYQPAIEKNIAGLTADLDRLDSLLLVSDDKAAVAQLRATFSEYSDKYKQIAAMIAAGKSSTEIDAVVKVSDTAALMAKAHLVARISERAIEAEHNAQAIQVQALRFLKIGGLIIILGIMLAAVALIMFLRRITVAHELLHKAQNEIRVSAAAFDTHDAIMITDANVSIIKVNNAFTRVTGYTPEEVLGQNPRFMKSGRHDKEFYVEMFHKLLRDGKWDGEIWDKRKNGEIYPRWMTITAIKDEQQKVIHYIGIFSDITERKKNEELISKLAFYDPLTQLPNRRMLTDRLGQAMASNKRRSTYGAVMFMDLDKFKPLNDTHGHVVGDLLLIEVGRRIKSCIRESDTIARFGGDEFVVLLSELNADDATSRNEASGVAEKIRICLSETYFLKPHEGGAPESCVEHNCSSSIGVTLFNGHEANQDAIFQQADAAMYRAKESGRNLVSFYDGSLI